MGEIKSTLDLVMEKTKHLSLSDEEKLNQKKSRAKNGLTDCCKNTRIRSCLWNSCTRNMTV
jgi:hypothetical protein